MEKYFFKEICAIMPPTRGFGYKNRYFEGFSPGVMSQKPFWDCSGKGCRVISFGELPMKKLPKISIITPTLNAENTIEACILSAAHQTYSNKEHLIIDGQSTDGTLSILKKHAAKYPQIKWVSEKDEGIYDAMNRGIDLSSGEWLYFLGSDDVFCSDTVLDDIFNRSDVSRFDVIYGNVKWGDTGRLYDGPFSRFKLLQRNICHQAIFTRKTVFNRLGKFDIKYEALADWVFNMQWYNKENINHCYIEITIARYNLDGYSSKHHPDRLFIKNRDALIEAYFPEEFSLFNKEISLLKAQIQQKEQEAMQQEQQLKNVNLKIAQMKNSLSWRITAPLRKFKDGFHQVSIWVRQFIVRLRRGVVNKKHAMVHGQHFNDIGEVELAGGSIGVHLHLYYVDLLNNIAPFLENIPFNYDLYVSIMDKSHTENIRNKLTAIKTIKSCTIEVVPNRGRDLAPFVVTFAEELLRHDFICHIHSKKSLYTGDEQVTWRKYLFDNLLGSPPTIRRIFGIFDTHKDVGLIYPETYPALPYWAHSWLWNRHIGQQLCNRFQTISDFTGYLDAPMGSMFWARSKAISPILSAGFSFEDFPEESGQNDGTLAHAIERMLVPVALTQDFTFCEISIIKKEFSLSFGSRNLSQYWRKNFDDLKRMIMRHAVITFDIFDTLVTRPLLDPDCVFDLLAIEVERAYGVKNFREIRKRAEHEIRGKNRLDSDVGIGEIYQRIRSILNLDESVVKKWCRREKEIEILLNMPRTEVVNALQFAKDNNKRTILMSDMYLDKATVSTLLVKNGVEGYDELYLSSELGVRKDNGSMWIKLLKEYPRSDILHIGDNEHSDVQIPFDMGIPVYHVMSPKNLYYNSLFGREFSTNNIGINVADATLTGLATAHLLNDPFSLNKFDGDYCFSDKYEFGYSVIGPIVFSYLLWIVKSAIKERFSTIYFLAREGYLLKQLFDSLVANEYVAQKLEGQITSVYLLASRRATTVPTIENVDDARTLLKKHYSGRLHNLLESRFGLSRHYLEMKMVRNNYVSLPHDVQEVTAIVREHFEAIFTLACEERVSYMRYLEGCGLRDAKDGIAVSDLGYSGNIQKALAKLLGIPLIGYYFVTNYDIFNDDRYANRFFGYFAENDDQMITECAVYKYSLVLESILTSPDGQLICFAKNGETVRPVFGSPNKQFDEIVKIHDGIAGYCNDMLTYFGQYILDFEPDKNVCQYLFHKIIAERRFDHNLFSLFKIEDNYCSGGEIGAL